MTPHSPRFSNWNWLLVLAWLAPAIAAEKMEVIYEDGTKQVVTLRQPSDTISRIDMESPVAATNDAGRPAKAAVFEHLGKRVTVARGSDAFADRVVQHELGNPAPRAPSAKPNQALGAPDFDQRNDKGDAFFSLGRGGSVTLQFSKVAIVDGPGPDLYVFELGLAVEPILVEVSTDGRKWISVGQVSGDSGAIDLAGHTKPGDQFTQVRLTDPKKKQSGRKEVGAAAGPDIDAVAALNCVPR